jgi:hypothetical protein
MTSPSPDNAIPAGPLRRWIISHDNKWLFIVPYIALAVTLSIVISLFWLVAVVAAHFALEWMRQAWALRLSGEPAGWRRVLGRTLWELKLDIALVLFALVMALYMDMVLGMAGLGAAARATTMAGVRAGARFTVWQQALRGILLSVDDLLQVARVLLQRRQKGGAPAADTPPSPSGDDLREAVQEAVAPIAPTRVDYAILSFGGVSAALLLLAPALTDHDFDSMLTTLGEELHPLPALLMD